MTPEQSAVAYARGSLLAYTRLVHNPNFERGRHQVAIQDILRDVETGKSRRVLIQAPPRHGKSMVVTEAFPAWYLGHHPDEFVMSASYNQELANDFGRKVRNLVADPMHQVVFPESIITEESAARDHFSLTAGGQYYAVGVGAAATGRGAHVLLVDDPIKDRDEAYSPTERKRVWDWFRQVAYTRLMPGGRVVMVMTRWHPDDLFGRILEQERRELEKEGWLLLSLPAIAEDDDPLGREEGEALWPMGLDAKGQPMERYSLKVLRQIKTTIGTDAFNALYQQRPTAEGGGWFKRSWLRYYEECDHKKLNRYIVGDPASSKKKDSDYTVMQVWGLGEDQNLYLLDMVRDRLSLTERWNALLAFHRKWLPLRVGYEKIGRDADIEYFMREMERINYRFDVTELGGTMAKLGRIGRLVPYFEAGRVYLPKKLHKEDFEGHDHDLIEDFIEDEFAVYPAAKHDDMLDAASRLFDEKFSLVWPLPVEAESFASSAPRDWMAA